MWEKELYIHIRKLNMVHFGTSISLDIKRGESIAVLGDNGSGKSTFLKYLAGLIRPSENNVITLPELDLYNEVDIYKYHRIAGYVPQNPEDILIFDCLDSDVRFGYENIRYSKSEAVERMDQLFEDFDMVNREDISYSALSSGELQRAAIVSALALDPEILIFDDAFSLLDGTETDRLFKRILDESRREGRIFIYSTHDFSVAEKADRIIRFSNGKIVQDTLESGINSMRLPAPMRRSELTGPLRKSERMLVPVTGGRKLEIAEYDGQNASVSKSIKKHSLIVKQAGYYIGKKQRSNVIFRNMDMIFYPGRLYTIDGDSGTGKSTLLRLLCGEDKLKKGRVYVETIKLPKDNKEDFKRLLPKGNRGDYMNSARKHVVYACEIPDRQLIQSTVIRDVMFGAISYGADKNATRVKAEKILREMDVKTSLWQTSIKDLSYGEKKMTQLAGVFASGADFLLLDKPFAGLDDKCTEIVAHMIEKHIQSGKTVILV